ncbi:MAG TPA: hypothetical protein QF555_05220 [Candidatus Thalassarchaeaceae archaeon]|jgi:hypothetical protein|nr:hypothetical protein [Candidatus Thalassarchaeaceae archaeon]
MQTLALLAVDKDRLKPFFSRVPELFHSYHHSIEQDSLGYEELLYKIRRPYSNQMLDMVDEWMGLEKREINGEQEIMLRLFLLAIRYPDTLLFESLDDILTSDLRRLSAYLHFTSHTYTIWDDDTRKGLAKLGFEIPDTKNADPFIYGAYVGTIELLKDLAPFTCFLEHDVPRQRLFQAALAAYGRE